MFSGIVQELGTVAAIQTKYKNHELALAICCSPQCVTGLQIGYSVAIDGVCLTVVDYDLSGKMFFDIIPETLECTTLGEYKVGRGVNIERSLKSGDEIGGHMVSGHVCGVAEIICIEKNRYDFHVPHALAYYLFSKGFVAIDGISLTISAVDGDRMSIGLIPETLSRTTLGYKREGDRVNIEPDMSVKTQVDALRRLHCTQ
ncbi:Riboflavin synthase [Chlamydia avium]|uniref:Riboflavin synthase n=1 Tax=Chlamydia avium TaxID=1457141 RepID=A0ABP2X9D9_9CHLA|nr:riboflavin synthase [Chlamydia avium]EPP37771.1 riboflavin synthase, alpha subunit [Chlamydia psittaci 10_743_SC13]EPP38829.1 riboflavin synthase, alpha subunit [Chlamydia avium]VVT42536.1 Riboflavin synthase [Chlamydia avium]